MPSDNMTEDEITAIIFNTMKKSDIVQYDLIYQSVYGQTDTIRDEISYGSAATDSSNNNRLFKVVENLIRSGLLLRGPHYPLPAAVRSAGEFYNTLTVTEKGKEVALSGNWLSPHVDPKSYVGIATDGKPWLSQAVKEIAYEAFDTWRSGHYLAGTALVGLVSEFIIEDFVAELEKTMPAAKRSAYQQIWDSQKPVKRIEALDKFFSEKRLKSAMGRDLKIDVHSILSIYANQLRMIRNKAAHRPGAGLSPEMVFMALQGIIDYISQLDDVLGYLKDNTKLI